MLTEDFNVELAETPDSKVRIVTDQGFSIEFAAPVLTIRMYPVCWVVSVDSAKENVEEEAKWLIDIAVGFLRLHYNVQRRAPRFPQLGAIEPHLLRPKEAQKVGAIISDAEVFAGGSSLPPVYEVGKAIETITLDAAFQTKADLIFDPKEKSLAARVSQGLGWLTRGRQAEDRAERLLYFFTAIESLLSSDDKSAPVIQTIARHAAVIVGETNPARIKLAAEIRKLYALRSALVHAGNRGVLWSSANATQQLAESMFGVVLDKCDPSSSHEKFIGGLSNASYGLPWPEPAAAPAAKTQGQQSTS